MSRVQPAHVIRRRRTLVVIALVLGAATLTVVLGTQLASAWQVAPPGAPSGDGMERDRAVGGTDDGGGDDASFGASGELPDGVTVFDDGLPAIANLQPDLLDALRRAAGAAASDGVAVFVNSGWRSPEYQAQLLQEAVADYGSAEEAARWVATPETSPHVQGAAVDLGPWDALDWLAQHGDDYGLCQVYANEPWHYELRPEAIEHGCPVMYADPTEDPRMAP